MYVATARKMVAKKKEISYDEGYCESGQEDKVTKTFTW